MTATTAGRFTAPRVSLVVLTIAVLLAAVVGMFLIGSHRQPPLIHAGLAGNGRILAVDSSGALMSYAADGGDPRKLATIPGGVTGISVSPDGSQVAYKRTGLRSGIQIRRLTDQTVVDIAAGDVVQEEAPTWSPDSRFITFTGAADGSPRLFVAATDGSATRDVRPASIDRAIMRRLVRSCSRHARPRRE